MNINIVKGTTPLSRGRQRRRTPVHRLAAKESISASKMRTAQAGHKSRHGQRRREASDSEQVTEIIRPRNPKTFDFFRASTSGEHIEKIYLAGVRRNPRTARSSTQDFLCRWKF